jgi:hypothetical protein
MNLWTIYKDILNSHYVPSVGKISRPSDDNSDLVEWPANITTVFILYAYFYGLIEDSDEGLNGFRVWRSAWPSEEAAISAAESRVLRFVDRLRVFRNRLDFMEVGHGITKRPDSTSSISIPVTRYTKP